MTAEAAPYLSSSKLAHPINNVLHRRGDDRRIDPHGPFSVFDYFDREDLHVPETWGDCYYGCVEKRVCSIIFTTLIHFLYNQSVPFTA